jgi:hypothetical protein
MYYKKQKRGKEIRNITKQKEFAEGAGCTSFYYQKTRDTLLKRQRHL